MHRKIGLFILLAAIVAVVAGTVIVGCESAELLDTTTSSQAGTSTSTAGSTTTSGSVTTTSKASSTTKLTTTTTPVSTTSVPISTTVSTSSTSTQQTTTTTAVTTTTVIFSVTGTISGLSTGELQVRLYPKLGDDWASFPHKTVVQTLNGPTNFNYALTPESWVTLAEYYAVTAILYKQGTLDPHDGDQAGEYADSRFSTKEVFNLTEQGFWTNAGGSPAAIHNIAGTPVGGADFTLSSTYERPVISGTISGLGSGGDLKIMLIRSDAPAAPIATYIYGVSTESCSYSIPVSLNAPEYSIGAILYKTQVDQLRSGDVAGEYSDGKFSSVFNTENNYFWSNTGGAPVWFGLSAGQQKTGVDFTLNSSYEPYTISGTVSGLLPGNLSVHVLTSSEGFSNWMDWNVYFFKSVASETAVDYLLEFNTQIPTPGANAVYAVVADLNAVSKWMKQTGDRAGEYSDGKVSQLLFLYNNYLFYHPHDGTPQILSFGANRHLTGIDFTLSSTYEP